MSWLATPAPVFLCLFLGGLLYVLVIRRQHSMREYVPRPRQAGPALDCPECGGTGRDEDAATCNHCGGDGRA